MKYIQNPPSGRFCRNNSENRPIFWVFLAFLTFSWGEFSFFVIPVSQLDNWDTGPPFLAIFRGVRFPFPVRFFITGQNRTTNCSSWTEGPTIPIRRGWPYWNKDFTYSRLKLKSGWGLHWSQSALSSPKKRIKCSLQVNRWFSLLPHECYLFE